MNAGLTFTRQTKRVYAPKDKNIVETGQTYSSVGMTDATRNKFPPIGYILSVYPKDDSVPEFVTGFS